MLPVAVGAVGMWESGVLFWPDSQARRKAWETRLGFWSFPRFPRRVISTARGLPFFLESELDGPRSPVRPRAGLGTAGGSGTAWAGALAWGRGAPAGAGAARLGAKIPFGSAAIL